jgi:CHASE3 domain sensor protein
MKNYSLIVFGDGEEEISSSLLDISTSTDMFLYLTYPISFRSTQTVAIIYNDLLDQNLKLRADLSNLNGTYLDLLSNYTAFLDEYNQLQRNYTELNDSYSKHLATYQEILQNFRSLTYIFAALAAVFIATTVYLSRRLHSRPPEAAEHRKYRSDSVS